MIFEHRDWSKVRGEGEEYFKFSICYCVNITLEPLEPFLENVTYDMNAIDLFNVLQIDSKIM